MKNKLKTGIICAALGLVCFSAAAAEKSSLKKIEADYIVKVGNLVLPRRTLDFIAGQQGADLTKDQIKQITDNWTEGALLACAAREQGLHKSGDYLWQLEQAKINILTQLYGQSLKDNAEKNIGKKDIKSFYDKNQQYFLRPGKVHCRHIIVPVDGDTSPAAFAAALVEIGKLRKEALKPSADFAALAAKHNPGVYAERQGDLGWFSREEMIGPIAEVAFALEPGEISLPVMTQFGYHIIKVLAKDAQPLDEVRDAIRDELVKQKVEAEVKTLSESLRKKYPVKVKP